MKTPKLHSWAFSLIAASLVFSSTATAPARDSNNLVPLQLYWNPNRADHFNLVSSQAEKDARDGGYEFVRTEAYVFATHQPGTVPMKLYWKPDRPKQDYFLTVTAQAEKDAKSAGYEFIRTEGYVYSAPQSGTVPLKLYCGQGNDNFLTATKQGERDAASAGYEFIRIEGYAVEDPQAFLSNRTIDYLPLIAQRRGLEGKEIVLENNDRIVTPVSFKPPVEITIVAKTDSTNLRIGYAADQVIFNWELDPRQLRVDGGPANGKHVQGAGLIPTDKFLTIKWIVTWHQQSIYVDGHLRFQDVGDYSAVDKPVSVFPCVHSRVTVKSLKIKRLSEKAADEIETGISKPS